MGRKMVANPSTDISAPPFALPAYPTAANKAPLANTRGRRAGRTSNFCRHIAPPRAGNGGLGFFSLTLLVFLTLLTLLTLLAAGCGSSQEDLLLSQKAKALWEAGQYADSARHFVTLAEIDPKGKLAEESLYWAANLYQHFLDRPEEAIRYYQQLLVQFPQGLFSLEARENLAMLYEQNKATAHRALQVFQQLLLAKENSARRDYFQFKIASLNLQMGVMDQARFEFRTLLTSYPRSTYLPEGYYLVGYSYYLEKRFPLALLAFRQAARDFPDSPIAQRALFFVAETLEEQGQLKAALKQFQVLAGKYHSKKILDKRIAALRARLKKGVR